MLLCVTVPDFALAAARRHPARTRMVWRDMLDALDALSPLVDDAAEGLAYLDMRGISGTARDWFARTHAALRDFDLPVRAALGPNKFAARAAAFVADGHVCTEQGMREMLEPLPLELLDLDPETIERLHLLGIHTLGQLAQLPHGPFVRRFGKRAARWHACAGGSDPEPLRPRAHELQIGASLYGEGRTEREDQLYFALRLLAERVCGDLLRAGRGATALRITFECENGEMRAVDVGLAQATADARTILDVARAKLEGIAFEAPVCGLRLQAVRLEEAGSATQLFANAKADPQAVALAIARLEAALGSGGARAQVRPAHRMEQRFAYADFAVPQNLLPSGISALPPHPVPQLRLLAVREVAVEVRGSTPVSVDARAVADCAGPWRIDDGWFETPVVRDEYDVLLDDGALYRIYRQGERWYLRGAYD